MSERPKCDVCGIFVLEVAALPNALWNRIADHPGAMLCLNCTEIAARCKGIVLWWTAGEGAYPCRVRARLAPTASDEQRAREIHCGGLLGATCTGCAATAQALAAAREQGAEGEREALLTCVGDHEFPHCRSQWCDEDAWCPACQLGAIRARTP